MDRIDQHSPATLEPSLREVLSKSIKVLRHQDLHDLWQMAIAWQRHVKFRV